MSLAPRSAFAERIERVAIRERPALHRLLTALHRRQRRGAPTGPLEARLEAALCAAEAALDRRRTAAPRLLFPPELPISEHRTEILEAIAAQRALVVCGDTGSGKTTQLPKLCLEAGRGLLGAIGITQPRRIAARAVASRLAAETGLRVGEEIGLKVRFTDRSSPRTLVKVMTDGILLNEIRHDRLLRAYDTLIIDEAHERTLNIDFLLGYLKRIRRERPDLLVIVTSATIDPERFADHLGGAPILRVAGRAFPIDYRYRPLARDEDLTTAVVRAVEELQATPVGGADAPRDILVFLPGERWIRESTNALRDAGLRAYDVLPLYARLSASKQDRIFAPGPRPRIVLATNVAETSLTVPRIGCVIDSGLARVSRYSPRHRLQSLGVEPVAQSSAAQRAGRAGRLGPGICVRLYPEDELGVRAAYTDPEILRTNLAGVILRLEALGLGHVDDFPFLDPPPTGAVNDAYRLLRLLAAVDEARKLTRDGERMAKLPLDPRLARLLVSARARGALAEGLVLAAALAVADPREAARGADVEQSTIPQDSSSDFTSYWLLWQAYQQQKGGGRRALVQWCRREKLSLTRMREWEDVVRQLETLVKEFGWGAGSEPASYKTLHQAILAGFADQIAERVERTSYRGPHGTRSLLAAGSAIARQPPQWLVAAERVATERVYLRTVARINPRWVIDAIPHLVRCEYRDPDWDVECGRVLAREIVDYGGLTLSGERRVDFGAIAPAEARALFIEEALVAGRLGADCPALTHIRKLREGLLEWEARLRTRDLWRGERALFTAFDGRVPASVRDRRSFLGWCRSGGEAALALGLDELATRDLASLPQENYPDMLEVCGQALELDYRYEPGTERDGITVRVPQLLLGAVRPAELDWLVPGWRAEKLVALLRTLPKALRRDYVPLPDTAERLLPDVVRAAGKQRMIEALCASLGEDAPDAAVFALDQLPAHWSMRIEVIDATGQVVAAGRDLASLQQRFAVRERAETSSAPSSPWIRHGLTGWSFPDLPDSVEILQAGRTLQLYPALIERDRSVDLDLLAPGPAARARHRAGVRRLLLKALPQQTALIRRRVRDDRALVLAFHGVGTADALADDLLTAAAEECFELRNPPRTRAAFEQRLARGRANLVERAEALLELAQPLLLGYRELRAAIHRAPAPLPAAAELRTQLDALVLSWVFDCDPRRMAERVAAFSGGRGAALGESPIGPSQRRRVRSACAFGRAAARGVVCAPAPRPPLARWHDPLPVDARGVPSLAVCAVARDAQPRVREAARGAVVRSCRGELAFFVARERAQHIDRQREDDRMGVVLTGDLGQRLHVTQLHRLRMVCEDFGGFR